MTAADSDMVLPSVRELAQLAGAKTFARGQGCVDLVGVVRRVRGGVMARVRGTEDYTVCLSLTPGGHPGGAAGLVGLCSCLVGEDGVFCKHCVALALVLLGHGAGREMPFDATPDVDADEVHDLAGLAAADGQDARLHAGLDVVDRVVLVELVWAHAARDPDLYRRLRELAS